MRGPPGGESRVSAGDIQEIMEALGTARHQLFIFASCYGGLLGQLPRRSAPTTFDSAAIMESELASRRARQFLSAGGDNQEIIDGGPDGLSWFTYWMLKAMEPGIVTARENGLLTFSEWAGYVQAYSANPYHTPAFGTLPGHRGGQFLLYTTDRGNPRLPPLREVGRQTLLDLGFLSTRGDPDQVRASLDDMKRPIEALYQAWQELDLDLHISQFDREVVQTGRFKSGRTFCRGYDEILAKRRELFARLDRVDVLNYEVMYQGVEGERALFGVRYNMDFHFRDGRIIREHSVKECYTVRQGADGRWRILVINDYQRRLCE